MCPHSRKEVVYHEHGVMVCRCRSCGFIQIQTQGWVSVDAVTAAVEFSKNMPTELTEMQVIKRLRSVIDRWNKSVSVEGGHSRGPAAKELQAVFDDLLVQEEDQEGGEIDG